MSNDATVFLVDDDPGALDSMQFLLESNRFSVKTFSSAREFLGFYDSDKPGCLILDLSMPEIDGLTVQERLVARNCRIPIIFVTGHGNVPKCAQALKAGAVDFLEKPVSRQAILDSVQKAMEMDRRRHRIETDHPEITARVMQLTPRERQVMRFMLEGEDIKTIARTLEIGFQTAAKHRAKALNKMQVRNEAELVRLLVNYPLERMPAS